MREKMGTKSGKDGEEGLKVWAKFACVTLIYWVKLANI